MCGIAGILTKSNHTADLNDVLIQMTNRLSHRGPDGSGFWKDARSEVFFGHRRLAIVDLSEAGHQPMVSRSAEWVICLNGEIYNFQEMRRELEGLGETFRGHSDTEVLLSAIERWGFVKAVQKSEGMFSIAAWSESERKLYLARDRFGEKPLYFGWAKDDFIFASELKALQQHPSFNFQQDPEAVGRYLEMGYVPSPLSIFKSVKKFPPGSWGTISLGQRELEPRAYWSVLDCAKGRGYFQGSRAKAADELDDLLQDVIKKEMLSDVPLGAFLSGGIDSSLVVALMQKNSNRPVKTFSIGFEDADYNEAHYAKAVAQHLKTDHTEFYVSPEDCLKIVPNLSSIFDEPFGDASAIPTHLVSALARKSVTVSLSGDGGDEIFGGYNRYFITERVRGRLSWIPAGLKNAAAWSLRKTPETVWRRAAGVAARCRVSKLRSGQVVDRIPKLIALLTSHSSLDVYGEFATLWKPVDGILTSSNNRPFLESYWNQFQNVSDTERMMLVDLLTYLPGDILAKVDRTAMATSLETRAPFLNHRVFEFSLRLPMELKISGGVGKVILRDLLDRYVPRDLIDRPKMGFGIPLATWLRGPLRDWAEGLIHSRNLVDESYFNVNILQNYWDQFVKGSHRKQFELWTLLQYLEWASRQKSNLNSDQLRRAARA